MKKTIAFPTNQHPQVVKALAQDSFRNIVLGTFSNLLGMEQGAKRTGFMTPFSNDIRKEAASSFYTQHKSNAVVTTFDEYHKHIITPDEVFVQKDVTKLPASEIIEVLRKIGIELPELEVACIVGGPPCFGMTTQNTNYRSVFHHLNFLMLEMVRLVHEIRPMTVWIEQVPALLTKPMSDFREVLYTHLDSLEDYSWDIKELNARDFGCYQDRSRAMIIMTRKDLGVAPSFPCPRPLDLTRQSAFATIGAEKFRSCQFNHAPRDGRANVFSTLTSGDYEVFRNNKWEKITLEDRIRLAHMEGVDLSGVSKTTLKKMLGMMVIPPFAEAIMSHIRSILEQAGKFQL